MFNKYFLVDQIVTSKRPAEIVRDYIEAEFFGPRSRQDDRLPTIHEFSKHLGVSPSTVRSVVKVLAEEGKLTTIPGKGTFLTSGGDTTPHPLHNCIGINVSSGLKPKDWGGTIFLGATSEALKAQMMISALDTMRTPNPSLEDIRKALKRVDGMIVFPADDHIRTEIAQACHEQHLPVVYINPPHFHHTSNFVSNDYFTPVLALARAWRTAGRRKIALIFPASIGLSVSSIHIHSAFTLAYASCSDASLATLDSDDGEPDSRKFTTHKEIGYERLKRHLEKHKIDAVYCFGDFLAEGAIAALQEKGLKIPDEISIAAGTGLDVVHAGPTPLTTLKQPLLRIGEEAVRMLLWRIQNHSLDVPGRYFMPELGEGETIRPKERALYAQLLNHPA